MMNDGKFIDYIKPLIKGLKTDQLYDVDEQVDIILELINKQRGE